MSSLVRFKQIHATHIVFLKSLKHTLLFALPIIASRLLVAVNGFLSVLIIAKVGQVEFAASTLITAIISPLLIITVMFLYPIAVLVGKHFGAEEYPLIGVIVRQGWLVSGVLGLFMQVSLPYFAHIIPLLHQPSNLYSYVYLYLSIFSWGMLPCMFSNCIQQFLLSISKSRFVLFCNLLSITLILFFGYGTALGRFGFQKMGILGVAYANVLTYWVIFLLQIIYLYLNADIKRYELFVAESLVNMRILMMLIKTGFPISLQFGMEWLVISMSTLLIGLFGANALIAQQITLQTNLIFMMVPFGISQAAAILISRALGRRDYVVAVSVIYSSIFIGMLFSALVACMYFFYYKEIISLYLNVQLASNSNVLSLATIMFMVVAISQVFDAVRNITIGLLRGYLETAVSMWVGVMVSCFISLPVGCLLAFCFHWGAIGIKAGFLVGFALGALILIFKLKQIIARQNLKV